MSADYQKIPTTKAVADAIRAAHGEQLKPFASFSDPTGTFMGGPGEVGRMETGFGIDGTDYPILWIRTTWNIVPDGGDTNKEHRYWLCVAKEEQ
jgi:hypothetical protein